MNKNINKKEIKTCINQWVVYYFEILCDSTLERITEFMKMNLYFHLYINLTRGIFQTILNGRKYEIFFVNWTVFHTDGVYKIYPAVALFHKAYLELYSRVLLLSLLIGLSCGICLQGGYFFCLLCLTNILLRHSSSCLISSMNILGICLSTAGRIRKLLRHNKRQHFNKIISQEERNSCTSTNFLSCPCRSDSGCPCSLSLSGVKPKCTINGKLTTVHG